MWAETKYVEIDGIVYDINTTEGNALVYEITEDLTRFAPPNEVECEGVSYPVVGFRNIFYWSESETNWWHIRCSTWEEVVLPANFTKITVDWKTFYRNFADKLDYPAFKFMTNLRTLTFDAASPLEALPDECFWGCTKMESITLPPSLKSIGRDAFNRCYALTSIDLGEVTEIKDNTFQFCTSLTTVNMPHVTKIGAEAFHNCSSLKTINTENVTEIGKKAFYDSRLTTATMPQVTEIGDSAFIHSRSLITVDAASLKKVGKHAFYNCTGLSNIDLSMVEHVADGAFESDHNLKSADCSSMRVIGEEAFSLTGLKEITFANPDLAMGDKAFYYLQNVTINCLNPLVAGYPLPMNSTAFDDDYKSSVTVNVPAGMGATYKGMYGWKGFKIVEETASVTLPEYVEVSEGFATWFAKYTTEQLSAVKRLKLSGSQTADDWAALKQMCDNSTSGLALEKLDASGVETSTSGIVTFQDFASPDTICLPTYVYYYPNSCFSGCRSDLVVVASRKTPPSLASTSAFGTGGADVEQMTLIVPSSAYSTYKNRATWKYFGTIKSADGINTAPWVSYAHRSTKAGMFGAMVDKMTDTEKHMLNSLVVSGPLNSADVKAIRMLCGASYTYGGEPTGYNVKYLDLSDATFVRDPNPFANDGQSDCTVAEGYVPNHIFMGITQVDTLWLPKTDKYGVYLFHGSRFNGEANANPEMKVFAQWNNPASVYFPSNAFQDDDVQQMTLVVPNNRLALYQEAFAQWKFGAIVEDYYEGYGAEPAEKLNDYISVKTIVTGSTGQLILLQGGDSIYLDPSSYSDPHYMPMNFKRSDLNFSLILKVKNGSDYKIYRNGEDYTGGLSDTKSDGDYTLYSYRYWDLGVEKENEVYLSIIFDEFEPVAEVPFYVTSNSARADATHIYTYDKDSDGSLIADTQEEVDLYTTIPRNKYVVVEFYYGQYQNNPYDPSEMNPVLTVNGETTKMYQRFDYTYKGNSCYVYQIDSLTTRDVWALECTFQRTGEPDPTMVTHYVQLTDDSGLATATYSYNSGDGETLEAQTLTFDVQKGSNTFQMPKVEADDKMLSELVVKVPDGYRLKLYGTQYEIDPVADEQKEASGGVLYTVYRLRNTSYQYRMENQTFTALVIENEPTRDWNVALVGNAAVNFELMREDNSFIDGLFVETSGVVKANAKVKKVNIRVDYMGDWNPDGLDDAEWLAGYELVAMADGQDISSLFIQHEGSLSWETNYENPLTGSILNTANWVIGIRQKSSKQYTWSLQQTGEVTVGKAEIKGGTGRNVATNNATPYSSLTWTYANNSMVFNVYVDKGYEFTVTFNGEDKTSNFKYSKDVDDRKLYTYTMTTSTIKPMLKDGAWVVTFTDPNQSAGIKGDVNGDGTVNVADVTKLVNIITGK